VRRSSIETRPEPGDAAGPTRDRATRNRAAARDRAERGLALVAAVILATLGSLVLAAVVDTTSSEAVAVAGSVERARAGYLAESGVAYARWAEKHGHRAGAAALPVERDLAGGRFRVEVIEDDPRDLRIRATGWYRDAVVVVEVLLADSGS